jgi:hypothetical protein
VSDPASDNVRPANALETAQFRMAALAAAARTHVGMTVPEVMHAAGCYLLFVLEGQPVHSIGQTIREGKLPDAPQAAAADVGRPAAAKAPPKPRAVPAAAQAAPAQPTTVPPPTNIKEVADELKKLIAADRDAAEGLLIKYGATMLSQVPGPKLAEFLKDTTAAINAKKAGTDLLA